MGRTGNLSALDDETPLNGPRIDVAVRVGWVLRMARLVTSDGGPLTLGEVASRAGSNTTRLHRLETGRLREGRLVEVACDTLRVNASVKVELNTPTVIMSGAATVTGRVTAGGTSSAGKDLDGHTHPDLTSGGNTGPNS